MAAIPGDCGDFSVETRSVSPAHFLVKIESFSLLSKNGFPKVESKEFASGGYKWKLVIYPEGHDTENNNDKHISVYVTMLEASSLPSGWEVNAIFSIFLYNQISDNYLCFRGKLRRFNAMKSIWGFSKLISRKSLNEAPGNGFLVDDNCVFGAEVFVIDKKRETECLSVVKDSSRGKHIWTISNFSKLEGPCTSEEFSAGGCKWNVKLYPTGTVKVAKQYVSMFLYCIDRSAHSRVKADFSISVKNQQLNGNPMSMSLSHWFTSGVNNWGLNHFVHVNDMRDESKGLVVNDCCIVETVVSVQATE